MVWYQSCPLSQFKLWLSYVGHIVGQIRLILRTIKPRGTETIEALKTFISYVQHFDFITQATSSGHTWLDPVTKMYHLRRALRSNGTRIGDIIPVSQFRAPVDIIPKFGAVANARLTKQTSLEYSPDVWLNPYFDKEIFYCLRSHNHIDSD